MESCEQYWDQLLQRFQCENEDQLVALGIPFQKNELYLSACSAADPETKKHYEETAALTLLHTHFRFIEYALNNDTFFMSFWAKHYSDHCVAGDEFEPIHQKILEKGGLDRFPQDSIRLTAMLLSVYGALGLSLDREPLSGVKATYAESMQRAINCLVNYKAPEIPDRRTPLQRNPKKSQNSKRPSASWINNKLQHYRFRLRRNATDAKIDRYCGYLFRDPSEAAAPAEKSWYEDLLDAFATTPERYFLPDEFGATAAERYAYLAEKIRPEAGAMNKRLYTLLENAYASDPSNETYKNARYEYLQESFRHDLNRNQKILEPKMTELRQKGNGYDSYETEKSYHALIKDLQRVRAEVTNHQREFEGLAQCRDPKIGELWTEYASETEKRCGEIEADAKAIQDEFDRKMDKRRKKRILKKILIPVSIILALGIIALIVVGVLL